MSTHFKSSEGGGGQNSGPVKGVAKPHNDAKARGFFAGMRETRSSQTLFGQI